MPAPICGECGFSLIKVKSGVVVAEMRDGDISGGSKRHGLIYRLWFADRFHCHTETCNFTSFIIADFGNGPFAERHDNDFEQTLEMHPPEIFWHERRGD